LRKRLMESAKGYGLKATGERLRAKH